MSFRDCPKDCRRRVELVEIKSAPPVSLNLLLTEERRVSECHEVVTKTRQGERLTSRSCELFGDRLERRMTADQVFRSITKQDAV